MEKTFIRVRSIKDIVIFASLIIAGGILIAIPTGAGVNIAGFFMIFAGIILSIILRTGYKDTETGERFQKKEHYFQQALMPSILQVIESNPGAIDMSLLRKCMNTRYPESLPLSMRMKRLLRKISYSIRHFFMKTSFEDWLQLVFLPVF